MIGSAQVIRGDARSLPLAAGSVDLVVSSPPYWSLRSYQDSGQHYSGQIGDEPTPAAFVDALIEATAEMVRVLKPSGSIWINLGDKYNAYNGNRGQGTIQKNDVRQSAPSGSGLDVKGVRPKSLIGVPWRYALRCIDDLGLILRAEVIWAKPNGLPESVTDRVRRSHETWFHFTKEPRYFSAVDEIREDHAASSLARFAQPFKPATDAGSGPRWTTESVTANPLGKLPGSVWTVPTQPLQVPDWLGIDHFAAFPMEFPRRIIQGWSPAGVCTACGEGRRPVSTKTESHRVGGYRPDNNPLMRRPTESRVTMAASTLGMVSSYTITGYECACPPFGEPAPTRPATILDPFGGTGTTALVAKALGRHGVSVDMSSDYCRLVEWRTTDRGQLAAAMQVEKPEEVHPDQLDLFADDIPAA